MGNIFSNIFGRRRKENTPKPPSYYTEGKNPETSELEKPLVQDPPPIVVNEPVLEASIVEEAIPAAEDQVTVTLSREDFEVFKMIRAVDQQGVPGVKSEGRTTIPDQVTLMDVVNNLMLVKPGFEQEYLEAIEWLAKVHPDVSNAVENMGMANTPYKTYFDEGIKPEIEKKMLEELDALHSRWYQFSSSKSGLTGDLFTQLAIYGAESTEGEIETNLKGIKRIVLPSPINIYFAYDRKTGDYLPYQKVPKNSQDLVQGLKLVNGQYLKLNPLTYRYQTIRRIGETPYGVPPFLSALNALAIQKDMVENLKYIIQKIGLLGFLSVLLQKPQAIPGENQTKYDSRLEKYLDTQADQVKKGLRTGFTVGYTKTEVDMKSVGSTSAEGADKLMNMNDRMVMTGLKQDPSMMGMNNTTTETFARVMFAKLGTQYAAYQEAVATVLAYYDLLHLQLLNYPVKKVIHEFEPVALSDKIKDEEAYGKKIANVILLRDENIIDQDMAANMLDFEEPAGPAPDKSAIITGVDPNAPKDNAGNTPGAKDGKKPKGDGKKTDPGNNADDAKKKQKAANWREIAITLGADKPSYDYEHGCECHKHSHNDSYGLTPLEENMWGGYNDAARRKFEKAVKKMTRQVATALQQLPEGSSVSQVIDSVMFHIMTNWGEDFGAEIKPVINKYVREAYNYYRNSKAPFGNTKKKIPEATLELRDIRALEYYKKSDNLYLGKFITDDDTIKRVNQWINDKYIAGDMPIGRNSPGIDAFKTEFGDKIMAEDWKIRRIIDTTMNRVKNNAAVNYMNQAGVEKFEILGVSDQLQCDFCASLQGKKFKVTSELSKLDLITSSAPENVTVLSPFITALDMSPAEVKKKSAADLQDLGIGCPPFHGHCRDTIVIADW